jgi:iron complex outermembrane recepter protein
MDRYHGIQPRPFAGRDLRLVLRSACLPALGVLALTAGLDGHAQERAVEEMIVTGTYIRRQDSFDTMSPINVIDSADIEGQGVANMGDVIKNQTYNYGTPYVTNLTASTSQAGFQSPANLRGLGASATLTLVNGRRTATDNVNILLPQIAISRIETLKDGASALYGSDAVSGVVNLVPKTTFEGLEASVWHLRPTDTAGDYNETQWQLIVGGGSGDTHLVGAFEYRERGQLRLIDRPPYARTGFATSGAGMPGTWLVPTRTASGALTGQTARTADPGCGITAGPGGTDVAQPDSNITGFLNPAGNTCQLNYAVWQDLMTEMEGFTGWAHASHEFSPHLRFNSTFSFASQEVTKGRGSPSGVSGRALGDLDPVLGTHPGNPFRAMANRGNGLEPLYARDMDGDGIPDRDGDGRVILAADPYDPAQGVAFNEDVRPVDLRLFGRMGTAVPSSLNADGSSNQLGAERTSYRWEGGVSFQIPDSTWSGNAAYSYNRHVTLASGVPSELFNETNLGLQGQLGPNRDQYFNPFSTALHPCANRVCDATQITQPGDPAYNTQFVVDQVSTESPTETTNVLNVFDAVITGDVIELPAGPLGIALGMQWRDAVLDIDYSPVANACAGLTRACALDFNESRTTWAAFGEVLLPILNHDRWGVLELGGALRWEDAGEFSSVDPKISMRWQPRDWLATRASYGTSFIAPSLTELFTQPLTTTENNLDPTCNFSPDCTAVGAFRATTFAGNPDLDPESATVWSLGFSLALLDGDLTLSFDYLAFDFEDRITRLRSQDVLDFDLQRFLAFIDTGGTRAQWIDPTNKATGNFESQDIIRSADGSLNEVLTTYINATEMEWRGFDVGVGYRFDAARLPFVTRDFGSFNLRFDGTYVESYTFSLTGLPSERCGVPAKNRTPPCQAAGNRNDRTGAVPPIPRIRANASLAWMFGNHDARLTTRYTHHVREDSVFVASNPAQIDAMTTIDLQYRYAFAGLFGERSNTTLTAGCINCLDEMARPMVTLGGLETFLHDPRGRMWYVRLNQAF